MPVWTISINEEDRKYKTFEINRKVRMDSPPEFTATIEYSDDVDFLNIITFKRDGITEWKGFIEDMEIEWDENGRYLILGGRDMSFLLWRKYVENFNNPIPKTGGFFGTVSASELLQFLLRTPRSDLPVNADAENDPTVPQYQYNKEGWGIDASRFNELTATNTAYGDIKSTILRTRNLFWSNRGNPYQSALKVVDDVISCDWDTFGSPPYLNDDDEINYIHSIYNESAEFSFEDLAGDASAINSCVLVIKWRSDSTIIPWFASLCNVQIWVDSISQWVGVGNFGGRNPPWYNPWRISKFDISSSINTVSDVNALKVKFTELSGNLATNITYSYLTISYATSGTQEIGDSVSMLFEDETIMGIYIESRRNGESFPRNYTITYLNGDGDTITLIDKTDNIYSDIIHSWSPCLMNNLTITISADDIAHGWEITQIYLYKTDDLKYRVTLDDWEEPVGEGYVGGPYIKAISIDHEYSTPIGPLNIPKNRLFDILWDLCIMITDDYIPYEWWIDYDDDNTFHISNRRGIDKSTDISFVTGVNMKGIKYAKSSRDTYQRCQVIGTGEGNAQVNSSSFWEVDEDAMDRIHGFIEDIVTQKQISSPRIANRYAKVKLMLDANPERKNAITCTIDRDTYATFDYTDPEHKNDYDVYDTYNVGDDVTVSDIFTSLDGAFRIYNIKKAVDNNGEVIILTVQAPYIDIGNTWTEIWDELKQLGIVGTIAQDWAGEGTDTSKVAADKLSTLFTVTAKNEETTTEPSTSPLWWQSPAPANNAGWKSDSNNLSIWGGDDVGGFGEIEVEARYEPQVLPDGTPFLPQETADILMNFEPKFSGSFKIIELASGYLGFTQWNDNDYVEFGLFNQDTNTGFKFMVMCAPIGTYTLYAIHTINGVVQGTKLIRTLSQNHKYRVEIITTFTTPINNVMFNVYDEEDEDPISTQVSVVFMNINGALIVRPIYAHAYGIGGANLRCIMYFYDLKCERKVV